MQKKNRISKNLSCGKVYIDREICTGCGNCAETAPEIFSLDKEGISQTNLNQINMENIEKVFDAIQGCPARAIIMEDGAYTEINK